MVAVRRTRIIFGMLLFLLLAAGLSAEIIQRIQSGIEDLARGMDYVGQRAGEMLGPGVSLSSGGAAAFTAERIFDEQYSLGPAPMVLLSNEFGEIRVSTWNERLVRIHASIAVGADSAAVADQMAELIEVRTTQGMDYLECRTRLPEIKGGGQVSMVVNYQVMVPQDAGLVVDNFFGDVYVAGLGGALVADVQYGSLELSQISGTVRAQVLGDFQVNVNGLKQGGAFKLQSATAEFSDFQGELSVQHFRGNVTIRRPAPQSTILLSSDSGRARIVLPPNANPDLSATLSYGKLESELDVVRVLRGQQLLARHPNVEADQRIVINAAFTDVAIAVEGKSAEGVSVASGLFKAFTDVVTEQFIVTEENSMVVTAMPGNIHMEGGDDDHVAYSATRIVWTPSAAAAMDALDALLTEAEQLPGTITLNTAASQDMSVFECEAYRVDLHIQTPRTMPVSVEAAEGVTSIENLVAGGTFKQGKGEIIIENAAGPLNIVNNAGAITLKQCEGPAEIQGQYGAISIEYMTGDIRVHSMEGRTHIEAPGGGVFVRNNRGDVRLLCIEPIRGDYDILVEDGNLNIFISPASDATFTIRATGGRVQSALSLTGSIERDTQEFTGRINEGTFNVRLETRNGDVLLN